MAGVNFSGPGAAGLVSPAQSKVTLESAYLDIRNSGWAQQYLPDLYEAEIERYNYPILDGLINGYKLKNEYDAIVLASEYIAYDYFLNSKNCNSSLPIWSALENKQIL